MSESNNPQRNDTIRYDTMRRYLVMFGLATSNKRPLHLFLSRSFFFFPCDTLQFFVLAHCEREPRKIWHANAKQMQMQIKTIQIHCTHLAQGQTNHDLCRSCSNKCQNCQCLDLDLENHFAHLHRIQYKNDGPVADVHTKYHQKKEKTKRHNNNQQTRHNQVTNKQTCAT